MQLNVLKRPGEGQEALEGKKCVFVFCSCLVFPVWFVLVSCPCTVIAQWTILLSPTFGAHCRYYDVAIALTRGIEICNWLSGLLNDLARAIRRWTEKIVWWLDCLLLKEGASDLCSLR